MLAYLIDPALRRITDVELPDDVRGSLDEMRRIIGCKYLEHWRLSDRNDEIWHDELAIERCEPVFAFQLRNRHGSLGPFGGRCIIAGADDIGRAAIPAIPREMIENDIDWLDEIVPEIHWITETPDIVHGMKVERQRKVVTWSRAEMSITHSIVKLVSVELIMRQVDDAIDVKAMSRTEALNFLYAMQIQVELRMGWVRDVLREERERLR